MHPLNPLHWDWGLTPSDVLIAAGGVFVALAILIPLAHLVGFPLGAPHQPDGRRMLDWSARAYFGVAPFEELLFRGVLFAWLSTWLPVIAAVVLSAAAFGFAHWRWGLPMMCVAGTLGLILATAYAMTGHIVVPILIHGSIVLAWQTVLRPRT